MFGTCWGLFLVKQTLWDGLCMFMWSEESQECQVLSTAWTMMAGLSLAPLILSHLRLSLTCAYHVSLAPRFLSHLRLVDWCGFTHVHTCSVTRVQSATDWTASVHTLHMSTPVM